MPASLGIGNDYKIIDNPLTVTHTRKALTGNTTDSVEFCQRFAISRREALDSGGFFTMQDVVFWLPVTLTANVPVEGDTITDPDSVVWSIIEVSKNVWDTIYRCVCRRER